MKLVGWVPLGPAVGAVAAAAALVAITFGAQGPAPQSGTPVSKRLAGADLIAYTSCAQLLESVKAEALGQVGPYGLSGTTTSPTWPVYHASVPGIAAFAATSPGSSSYLAGNAARSASEAPAAAGPLGAASNTPTAPGGARSYSTTNDQEIGVDEPDMVKTNGELMAVLRQQPLGVQVVNVSGNAPRLEGFLALPQLGEPDGLFLSGQYAVVIGTGGPMASLPADINLGHPASKAGTGLRVQRPLDRTAAPQANALYDLMAPVAQAMTEVVVVSLADPAHPNVARTFSIQGYEEGARLINGQVEVVVQSGPQLPWAEPAKPGRIAAEAATEANREMIETSTTSDWLPHVTASRGPGHTGPTLSKATACAKTYHTATSPGLGTVSVVSLNPSFTNPGNEVTVMGSAEDVYASATQLFVAAASWQWHGWSCPPNAMCPLAMAPSGEPGAGSSLGGSASYPGASSTEIYVFDLSGPAAPAYLGSGSVPGTLIGQYAMSEYDGYLRVATTVGNAATAPADGGPAKLPSGHLVQDDGNKAGQGEPLGGYSYAMVSVLQPQGGSLVTVGTLSGLGTGEKIYAVRFAGSLAYVVTFRQTDPLYVVDLNNPARPTLAGQVSLEGYSSFLQPLTANLLLGIGESVNASLRTQGLQLEIFDVSHPSQPTLVARDQLGADASSSAEYDPHAVLWWPSADLLVLPVDNYDTLSGQLSSVAEVWSVSPSGVLSATGQVAQPSSQQAGTPQVERAVVVGNNLYTVSEQGVMASNLSTLSQVAWLPFGGQ